MSKRDVYRLVGRVVTGGDPGAAARAADLIARHLYSRLTHHPGGSPHLVERGLAASEPDTGLHCDPTDAYSIERPNARLDDREVSA